MAELALPFSDRHHAGCVLAGKLAHYGGRPDVLVLALPRGGVAVGFEVARALQAPLDVLMVRKLGFPGQEEYAMGAIASGASGGVCVMNPLAHHRVSHALVDKVIAREQAELERREQLYRGQRRAIGMADRCVIVVDDGLATGATMRAALRAIRQQQPARLVAAVPVGAEDSCQALQGEADEVVCAAMPQPFRAVGLWYEEFEQASDDEVCSLLHQAYRAQALSLQ
jgi:putative phosphoribosyl transferase